MRVLQPNTGPPNWKLDYGAVRPRITRTVVPGWQFARYVAAALWEDHAINNLTEQFIRTLQTARGRTSC